MRRCSRSAALLVAQKRSAAAIDRLRDITRAHPQIAVVRYQTGTLLQRSGRLAEAENAFRAVAAIEPDSPYIQIALADVLLRSGRDQDASDRAALAMALAEHQDGPAQAAAHRGGGDCGPGPRAKRGMRSSTPRPPNDTIRKYR